jgi:hypothetical protein
MTTTASAVPLEPIPVVRAVRSTEWRVLRQFSCSDDWQEVGRGDMPTAQRAYANHLSALGRGALALVCPDGSVAESADAEVPA